jgi:predicted MFS family arabinose efflux permease
MSISTAERAEQLPGSRESNVDNAWTVCSVVTGSGIALLPLLLGPLLVGEYVTELGVSESNAGMILSTELSAFALGAAMLFAALGQNWRHIVTVALLLMTIGNALFLFVDTLYAITLARFIAGLGAGILMTMTMQVIALTRDPDRIYGLWTVGQLLLGALATIAFPDLIAAGGIKAVFLIWALLAVLLFATIQFYPAGPDRAIKADSQCTTAPRFGLGLLCLFGLFIYYSGQTGVWVYLERLGESWGIGREMVADTLFASLISGVAGSGLAILLGNKLGRTLPITVSLLISAAGISLLILSGGATVFTVAACLFNFGWYLFLPYITAVIAAADDSGKLLTSLAVTFPASLAAGPAVAAILIDHSGTLLPCLIFGLISIPFGWVFILPATRAQSI